MLPHHWLGKKRLLQREKRGFLEVLPFWQWLTTFQVLLTLLTNFHLSFHTILKVELLSQNSILTKPRHFHEFFTQIFLTIFLVKSKLSTAKKSKTTTFSRVFHSKNRQFSREIKVEFLDKKWRFLKKNETYLEKRHKTKSRSKPLKIPSTRLQPTTENPTSNFQFGFRNQYPCKCSRKIHLTSIQWQAPQQKMSGKCQCTWEPTI